MVLVWWIACASSGTATFSSVPEDPSKSRLSLSGPGGAVVTTYDVAMGAQGPEVVGYGTSTLGSFGATTVDTNYYPASGGPYDLPPGVHVHLAAVPSPAGTLQTAATPADARLTGVWAVLDDAAWDQDRLRASAPPLKGVGADVGAAASVPAP